MKEQRQLNKKLIFSTNNSEKTTCKIKMNLDIDLMLQILIQVDDVHAHSVSHLRLTLCNPMDYSPPDSSVHGIFQARILEWVAISKADYRPDLNEKYKTFLDNTGENIADLRFGDNYLPHYTAYRISIPCSGVEPEPG